MWADVAVRGSIAVATLSWASAEWLRLRHPSAGATARACWTLGAASTVVHTIAVFHNIHGWSQDAALAHTAQQTAVLTGLRWGGGLYVNYAFIALWVADAALWWHDRAAYERRSAGARDALLAVFLFMFVNAGIVFAHGPARVVGTIVVGIVLLARFGFVRPRRDTKQPIS